MSRVHPLKRAQVAAAAFAVLGLALVAAAEPLAPTATDAMGLPLVEATGRVEAAVDVDAVAAPRRAWRDQLPAVIVVRRVRPS